MRIQTILNRVEKFKSFVYGGVSLEEQDNGPALVVHIQPRRNNRPVCSGRGLRSSAYDRLEERRFAFVPLWGTTVFLAYRMHRVAGGNGLRTGLLKGDTPPESHQGAR